MRVETQYYKVGDEPEGKQCAKEHADYTMVMFFKMDEEGTEWGLGIYHPDIIDAAEGRKLYGDIAFNKFDKRGINLF